MTGNKTLDNEDLKPILDKFKDDLMTKNVAEEIAQHLCDSMKNNLMKTKSEAFTSLNTVVKRIMNEALTKILTPKRNIDIIADV